MGRFGRRSPIVMKKSKADLSGYEFLIIQSHPLRSIYKVDDVPFFSMLVLREVIDARPTRIGYRMYSRKPYLLKCPSRLGKNTDLLKITSLFSHEQQYKALS